MHKHEGIIVVAYKPGQPASQVEADLHLDEFTEFTTAVYHQADGEQGMAAKVNLYDEAAELRSSLESFGYSVDLPTGNAWQVL